MKNEPIEMDEITEFGDGNLFRDCTELAMLLREKHNDISTAESLMIAAQIQRNELIQEAFSVRIADQPHYLKSIYEILKNKNFS